jgi:hypothetical protein
MATPESNMMLLSDLHKIDEDVLRASYERTSDILASQDRHSLASEGRAHRNADHTNAAIHMASDRNLASLDRNADRNLAAIERNGTGNLVATTAVANQAERLQNENVLMHKDTYRHLSEIGHHYGEAAARDTGVIIRDLNRMEIRMDNQFCDLKLQAQENTCKLEMQAANNFAAVQLEALRNRNDLMQKVSDCCCEVKERISTSEANVKDLMKALESERIRDALKAAETRNLVLEISGRHHSHHGHHGGNGNGQGNN